MNVKVQELNHLTYFDSETAVLVNTSESGDASTTWHQLTLDEVAYQLFHHIDDVPSIDTMVSDLTSQSFEKQIVHDSLPMSLKEMP